MTTVFVKSFGEGPACLAGSIVDTLSSLSMQVKLTDGRVMQRYIDHVVREPGGSIGTKFGSKAHSDF